MTISGAVLYGYGQLRLQAVQFAELSARLGRFILYYHVWKVDMLGCIDLAIQFLKHSASEVLKVSG